MLDALDTVGIRGDGRLLALNSYENRVYQVWRDDAPPVVAKFYRPARWSDAQILEEHAFVAELARARNSRRAAARPRRRARCIAHAGFRFAVFARRGGRAPELERSRHADALGRFIAPHPRGRRAASRSRTARR